MTSAGGGAVPAGVLEGLAQRGRDLVVVGDAVHLRVTGEAALPGIAEWLVGRGVRLYGMSARRRSLEDLFLEVMGHDQRPG
jgi:hypothetical protein